MLTVEEAQARILDDVPRVRTEEVPLGECYGRWLAGDVTALDDLPRWDNSGMDGYAVRAADTDAATPENPVRLALREVIPAGGWPLVPIDAGAASAVMTGAPMPDGADAVVMVEDTDGAREGTVAIRATARPGQHVRPAGDDVRKGTVVLRRGTRLGPAQVGLASALGYTRVSVARRPVVAVLSTGDEVAPPGMPLRPGQIYSSNNASLVGLVHAAGGIPVDCGIVPDSFDATVAALRECVENQADIVVTTGGVSVGAFDFVKDAIAGLGGRVEFWKVNMKPGKPLAFGHLPRAGGRTPVFGLPGNPVSCVVNFLQFVRPWLLVAMGADRPFLPVVDAVAGADIRERPGRYCLVRVRLAWKDGAVVAVSAGNQSSGALSGLAGAHGFALLPADSSGVAAGAKLRVQVFDPSFLDRADPGYGW